MVVAGIDVGSAAVKAVLMGDGQVLSQALVVTGEEGAVAAQRALDEALQKAGLSQDKIAYLVATGVGKKSVAFANKQSSEVACQGKGALFLFPAARTVVNLGAETSRALRLNDGGRVESFTSNEKCAAGSGLFLETMARLLEVPLERMGQIALETPYGEDVASMCAVFAESEVISHVHRGVPKEQIVVGLHQAVADRIMETVNKVGVQREVVITGGTALHAALIRALENIMRLKALVPVQPQMVGALGAALLAQEALG